MAEPTKIRAQMAGTKTTVRVLMRHEMESGQRKNESGQTIPPWHIREVMVQLNGATVLTAQWGPSVSKDPFLQFNLKGAKPGDKVSVIWVDTQGERRSDDTLVG